MTVGLRRICHIAVTTVVTSVLSTGIVWAGSTAGSTPITQTAVFVAIPPARLVDTRTAVGFTRPDPATVRIAVAGQHGVPRHAAAVVVTVTTVDAPADGYLTAFSGSVPRWSTDAHLAFRQ